MSSFGGNSSGGGGGGGGGDASAANQVTGNTSLASIDSKTPSLVSGRQPVDGSGVTQPVSAASLPLPTGAATSALQNTANTSLSSISTSVTNLDAKSPTLVSGRVPVETSGTVNAAAPVWSRTSTGAITASASGTIKNSPGRLRGVWVLYAGSGTSYFQLHDKLGATSLSDSTLVGFGFSISATNTMLFLDLPEELVMSTGICWALSSTQATYTSTVQTAYVFAEYI